MVALGDTVEEAFYKIFHLQAACEIQVSRALGVGLAWPYGGPRCGRRGPGTHHVKASPVSLPWRHLILRKFHTHVGFVALEHLSASDVCPSWGPGPRAGSPSVGPQRNRNRGIEGLTLHLSRV